MSRQWEPLVLGVLAKEGKFPGSYPAFINNSNDIQLTVRILSKPPYSFPNSQHFVTCWGKDLEDYGFEDTLYDGEMRIKNLIDFLDGQLFVFQIDKKITPKDEFFIAKNIHLIPKKESFVEIEGFEPVPIFSEKDGLEGQGDYSWNQFISNLKDGLYIGRNDQISREPEDTPRLVFYRTLEDEYFAVGDFESHHYAHGGFSFTAIDQKLKYQQIEKKIMDEIYMYQNVAYTSLDSEHKILTSLQEVEGITTTLAAQAKQTKILATPGIELPTPSQSNESPQETSDKLNTEEEDFMNQFIAETKKLNLNYNVEDLYNFHTCVKTGGLTILAGMSGTGKSQLVNTYQKALNIDSDKFIMVPVSPTWTDDSDLIGYPDIINNVYRPADSGIVNLLIEAEKYRSETFIICFDEMNLAKVEHYFSQFLSVMEMDKGRRKLKLYNRELENKFYNGSFYPPEVSIGDNVIFTGTVNLDDSTHHFSDKVLDRANLLELHVEPFKNLLTLEQDQGEKLMDTKQKNSYIVHAFIHQNKNMVLTESELEFLWDVHNTLQKASATIGIGPRIVKQIDNYIKNLSDLKNCPIDRKKAFDLQFSQRILPKIRGTEEVLKPIVGVFDNELSAVSSSQLIDLLDKYSQHSDFSTSRAMILEKAKELTRNGFAF